MKPSIESLRHIEFDQRLGYDLMRIFLGIALLVRGALFVVDPARVFFFMRDYGGAWFWPTAAAHYVGIAHVSGGLLLAAGLTTRLAAIIQIPVLLAAVFVVHWREGLLEAGQSLELAALVLVMLIVFAVFGAGPLSMDQLVFRREPRDTIRRTEAMAHH
jgi:uncharacterized membrane protein YphA (DoxX/SURF4 family)